jgi:uncharacterized protein YfdQ (DUF2303 family)
MEVTVMLPAIWALKSLERMYLSPVYKGIYGTAAQESFVSIEQLEGCLGFIPRSG